MYSGDDESHSRVRWPDDEALVERLAAKLGAQDTDSVDNACAEAARRQRLARIKHAVEASEYENPLKLSIALDRVLDRIDRLG